VLGEEIVRDTELARTGSNSGMLVLVGIGLAMAGTVLTVTGDRLASRKAE
jgi:hypothetical protein